RRPRQLRRRRRHRGGAGRGGRRPLLRRRQRAQADGRLRADPEALMAARRIDGKAVAAAVRERVKVDVEAYAAEAGRAPLLATILVGEDPASQIYIRKKGEACEEAGMRSVHHGLDASTPEAELLALIRRLGEDEDVDGILCQLPVPAQIDEDAVVAAIDPRKDVDGLTPWNAGLLAHGE